MDQLPSQKPPQRQMLHRLWDEIKRIKRQLSKDAKAATPLDSETGDDLSLNEIVTRDLFNELNIHAFAKLQSTMTRVLIEASVQAGEIDEIVFVGGSSHLLRVRQLVSEFFEGKSWAHTRYLPDSAVADGAAVHGGAMGRDREDSYWFDCLHTGVSLSLGVETAGGLMHELISRQTSLPHIRSMRLTTFHDNQTEVTIRIFAGERPLVKYNRLVGALTLRGLAPTPSGLHNVVLTLSVDDTNSFVVVSATENTTGIQDEATLPITKHRFIDNADVVVQLIKKADAHIEDDTREAERVEFCLQNRKLSEVDCAGIVVTSDAVVPISLLLTANDEEF